MGLFKSLQKGLKKIGKGVVKGLKSVGKFVGSAVSKIADSGLGKALVLGAAVWATGGLLAAAYGAIPAGASAFSAASVKAGFGALGSSVGGALGIGQGAAATTGAATTGTLAPISAVGGTAQTAVQGSALANIGVTSGGGLVSASPAAISSGVGSGGLFSAAGGGVGAAASAAPSGGLFSSIGAAWNGMNPITQYGAMQAAGNAFTAMSQPTEEELLQAQINAEQERLRLSRENFQLGSPMDYRVYTGDSGPYRSM